MAAGFLASLQVIASEAQGDPPLLQELSEKVAEVSATGGISVSSSGAFSLPLSLSSEPALTGPDALAVQPWQLPATSGLPSPHDQTALTNPEPAASPEQQQALVQANLCAPAADGSPYCTYVVRDGDTLWGIAETLRLSGSPAFSAAELLAMSNDLNDAQNWIIIPGQELRVPAAAGVVVSVEEGQTLSVLAELYGVSTADVILANGVTDANDVVAGQTMLIPSPNLWPLDSPGSADTALVEETEEPIEEEAGEEQAEEAGDEGQVEESLPAGESTEEAAPNDEESEAEQVNNEPATDAPSLPPPSPQTSNPTVPQIRDQFAAGYIAAGGPAQYLEHILTHVIPCESGYNLRAYNPAGPFYGLMQFLPQTWANTGGGEWADAWQQGHNTGKLLLRSTPRSQWPFCWG